MTSREFFLFLPLSFFLFFHISLPFTNPREFFRSIISKNTNYPKKCRKEKIEGKVYLTFVLNEDGNPINTYVIKGPDMLLNIEAVRVINSLQNITPIKRNGRPVKYKLNIPFNFKL